jgi:MFS family permease
VRRISAGERGKTISTAKVRAADPPRADSKVWRNTKFVRYWLATTVSGTGTSVSLVAIPLLAIYRLHASDDSVGLLRMAEMLPYLLLSITAGIVVDRVRRRPLLAAADLARFLLVGLVPLLFAAHLLTMVLLIAVMAAVGCCTVSYDVAQFSLLPTLVGEGMLVEANSGLESARGAANSLGPGLGGVLVGVLGPAYAVLADAGSYLYSGLTFLTMREVREAPEPAGARRHVLEGARFVARTPLLRYLTAYLAVNNFVIQGLLIVALLFFVHVLALPSYAVGIAVSAYGAGFVLGALLARRAGRRLGVGRLLICSSVLGAAGILIVATAPPLADGGLVGALPAAVAGMALAGLAAPLFNVHAAALRIAATPRDRMGRVTAAVKLCSQGTVAAGAAVGGVLAGSAGPRAALFLLGAASLAVTVLLLPAPVRHAEHTGPAGHH